MRAALLTVSTSRAHGDQPDESGAALAEFIDGLGVDLVLTSGGTGLAPDDATPEATRAVTEREAPGIAEAMREEHRRVRCKSRAGRLRNARTRRVGTVCLCNSKTRTAG
jgi:molybdopterin biosynthesis enzyme MoaB